MQKEADSGVAQGRETTGPDEAYPLTPIQEGMLFHRLSEPGSGIDVEQIVVTLNHEVDPARMQEAWSRTALRHPRLGATFRWAGLLSPEQRDAPTPVHVHFTDLSGTPKEAAEERFRTFLGEDRERAFPLDTPPLLRIHLFRFGPREHRLVWTFPHILMDGRSFPLVLRDVFAFLDRGEAHDPGTPPPSFRGFVRYLADREDTGDEAFWRAYLAGYGEPATLLPDAAGAGRGRRGETVLRLDADRTRALSTLAKAAGVSMNTVVQGAWALLLARRSGRDDVVFGTVRARRSGGPEGAADMVGVLINTLPVRVRLDPEARIGDWLREVREDQRRVRPHEHASLVRIRQWSALPPEAPLFESLVIFDREHLDTTMRRAGFGEDRSFELLERTSYPLTLYAYAEDRLLLRLAHDEDRLPPPLARGLMDGLVNLLAGMAAGPDVRLGELELLSADERARALEEWNATARPLPAGATLHGLVLDALRRDPERPAVVCGSDALSAGELEDRSGRVAAYLAGLGVGRGDLVGVALPTSVDQLVVVLGVLRCGAAYVPLDPAYPEARRRFMMEDAALTALVTTSGAHPGGGVGARADVLLDREAGRILGTAPDAGDGPAGPGDRAYVLYTSGSTGKPKGVEVEHRSVVNFLVGMDAVIPAEREGGAWLSLTSLSFDISVLERFRPLVEGRLLVLHREARADGGMRAPEFLAGGRAQGRTEGDAPAGLDMSLFYFAADAGTAGTDPYRLLLEGARFADAEGFSAVWTPERHFHAFGGLYPAPSVVGAAVAAVTSRVQVRAGSVVLPLHHPVRVAEEWSVVDNLSGGRVGISFASGWHPDDFVLAPERHADRKAILFRDLEVVRRLWRGEKVAFPGPGGDPVEVGILPRPVQHDLPVWITTAGNVETYREAGAAGARVLTHLLGQTVEEVEERVRSYRQAWSAAGHPGSGYVSLMLHTFVGDDDDAVREQVREPMKAYLKSSVGLLRNVAGAWTAYRRTSSAPDVRGDEFSKLSDEDLDALLEFAFERYFETSGLFGSEARCIETARRLQAAGVDEIVCLVDFGVEADVVLDHLPHLARVRRALGDDAAPMQAGEGALAAEIRRHGVTHLQCTPSELRMLLADPESREALSGLDALLVGGEAFPGALAEAAVRAVAGKVVNMYGPTETTIWSTTLAVDPDEAAPDGIVPIGLPIVNTRCYVLDSALRPLPPGVVGELFIGGAGVARGYLGRPELTAERFLPDPFTQEEGSRMYRTGDRVRRRDDGILEFLGRVDQQVKLRGHRIETGEIESALESLPDVAQAAVVLREDRAGDSRLAAYLVPAKGAGGDGAAVRSRVAGALATLLPPVMVPSTFTLVEALPLTPNRKVDRAALPAPREEDRPVAGAPGSGPVGGQARPGAADPGPGSSGRPDPAVVRGVTEIWSELLGATGVGLDDNFFDLGGHSLLTVQVHDRIRARFGRDLRILDLFRNPTVRTLSLLLSAPAGDARDAGDAGGAGAAPVSEPVAGALDRGVARRAALRRRGGER